MALKSFGVSTFTTASEFLSDNEIAASKLAKQGGIFNPQQQFCNLADASFRRLAYVDQLNGQVTDPQAIGIKRAFKQARLLRGGTVVSAKPLAQRLSEMALELGTSSKSLIQASASGNCQ